MVDFVACAAAIRALRFLETHGASVTWDGAKVVVAPPHREADGVIETLGDLLRPGADGQSLLDQAWARHEPLVRTIKGAKPSDASDAQWRLAIEGLQIFLLSGWADEAERCGWSEVELYRIPPVWARIELCGAALLIGDREVIEITADAIRIKTASGAVLSFYRKSRVDYAFVYRERLKMAGDDGLMAETQLRTLEATVNLYRHNNNCSLEDAKTAVTAVIRGPAS